MHIVFGTFPAPEQNGPFLLRSVNRAVVDGAYMELFDLVLNCYEKLFQSDIFPSVEPHSLFFSCVVSCQGEPALSC